MSFYVADRFFLFSWLCGAGSWSRMWKTARFVKTTNGESYKSECLSTLVTIPTVPSKSSKHRSFRAAMAWRHTKLNPRVLTITQKIFSSNGYKQKQKQNSSAIVLDLKRESKLWKSIRGANLLAKQKQSTKLSNQAGRKSKCAKTCRISLLKKRVWDFVRLVSLCYKCFFGVS